MRFIDEDQLARSDRFRVAIDRIDGGKQNLRVGIARSKSLAIDTYWCVRPYLSQFLDVLID